MPGTCENGACAHALTDVCECSCHGAGHNRAARAANRVRAAARHSKAKRARTRAERAGRDQDREQRYRALHPSEIMGGGLVATKPRRARDVGGDDYRVAVQAWLDRLESSGHADDVPRTRQGSFWNSARTGRGWSAQERSVTGQRRGTSRRPLEDWMAKNPRPRRADFRGRDDGEHGGRMSKAEWAQLQRDLDAGGW